MVEKLITQVREEIGKLQRVLMVLEGRDHTERKKPGRPSNKAKAANGATSMATAMKQTGARPKWTPERRERTMQALAKSRAKRMAAEKRASKKAAI